MTSRDTDSRDGGDSKQIQLSQDEIFDVLSNRRRRFVVHALKHEEEPVDFSTLSERVTAWELGVDPGDVQYEERRNVYSTLRRTHIPKLEEKNVVTVDEEADLVAPTPALDDVEIYIEVVRDREIPWSFYYLGLGGLTGSILLAIGVDVPGFAGISPLSASVFATTLFGVSALTHHFIGPYARFGEGDRPPELRDSG
jgi:DNA-binding transcriptional ArsR family regulator